MNSQIVPAKQMAQIAGEIQRSRSNHHQSDFPYNASTRCSILPMTRSIQFCFEPWPRSFKSRAHISGVSVSETKPDARIATTIVIANSRKRSEERRVGKEWRSREALNQG